MEYLTEGERKKLRTACWHIYPYVQIVNLVEEILKDRLDNPAENAETSREAEPHAHRCASEGYPNHVASAYCICTCGQQFDAPLAPSSEGASDRDPLEWFKAHPERLARFVKSMKCDAHAPMGPDDVPTDDSWGQEGHLWKFNGDLLLCQPKS